MSWILDTLGGLFQNILGRGQEMGMMKYQQGLQHQTMQKQFGLNSQAMEHQANLNYEQWLKEFNMQNQYNTPAQQLQRIKDAGLNAALMYGRTGVTNSNTMGAGSGSGLGSISAPGVASTPSDVGGSILKYQEAKRSPQRDALTQWQAAIAAEEAISKKFNNLEIQEFVEWADNKDIDFVIDKNGRIRMTSVQYFGNLGDSQLKAKRKLGALGQKTSMLYRKQEVENLLNDALETMQQIKNSWAKLGANPSQDSTVLSLLTVLKNAGMSDKEIAAALAAYNITGEIAKNILNRLTFIKGSGKIQNRNNNNDLPKPKYKNRNNDGPTPGGMKPGTWGGNALEEMMNKRRR